MLKTTNIFRKRIGVLGGMGPTATISFYARLIGLSREKFGARANNNYPYILICNLPVPDLIADKTEEKEVFKMLVAAVKELEKAGVDFIVIPCNTVHLYLKRLKGSVNVPILNLIELVAKEVEVSGVSKVGILATRTTLKEKLYQQELGKRGIEYCVPTEQEINLLVQAELGEVAGESTLQAQAKILRVIQALKENGVEGVILGCTELPLLIGKRQTGVLMFDTLEILAEKALEFAFREKGNNYD